jgi:hypothetical protein
MSFKMDCPHCKRGLNVTEIAFGKTLPCPGCNQLVAIPQDPAILPPLPPLGRTPMPAGTPPIPPGSGLLSVSGAQWGLHSAAPGIDAYQTSPHPDAPAPVPPASESAAVRRPFGIVWIVFYWTWTAIPLVAIGLGLQFMGSLTAGLRDAVGSGGGAALGVEVVSLIGLACFHLGLLTLVTCYGLWTYRRWALLIAKVLAVVFVLFGLIGFVAALVMRTGIVTSLANTLISAAIVVYLFGATGLFDRAQRYVAKLRSQTPGPDWQ